MATQPKAHTSTFDTEELEKLYRADIAAAHCGCGGVCRECGAHQLELRALTDKCYDAFLKYCTGHTSENQTGA